MQGKKKRLTMGKQVLALNFILTGILLCVFVSFLLYMNAKAEEGNQKYSQKVLATVDDNFTQELVRLGMLGEAYRQDTAIIINSANRLGISALDSSAEEISEKLRLICYALPYAKDAFLYVNNTKQIISSSGSLSGAIYQEKWYTKYLENHLAAEESLPDFSALKNGFYTYENFTLYVCSIYGHGSVVVQVDANQLFNLKEIYSLLPNHEILVLDAENKVFASSGPEALAVYGEMKEEILGNSSESWYENGYQITQRYGNSGFHYIVLGHASTLQRQQLWLNFFTVGASLAMVVVCFFVILLNAKIYAPLRQMVEKLGTGYQENEIDAISGKFNELTRENRRMTQLVENQKETGLDMALNYVLRSEEVPDTSMIEQIQQHLGSFLVVVVAAQGSDGRILMHVDSSDSYFVDTLGGFPVHFDGYVHAYVIPADLPPAVPAPQEITDNLERYFVGKCPEDTVFVGISDLFQDVRQLHSAFEQAKHRMFISRLEEGKTIFACAEDRNLSEKCIIPLEIQNTVVECTRNGNTEELLHVLHRIFGQAQELSLQGHSSLYQTMVSLLHIVLSSAGIGEDVQSGLETLKNPAVYNPHYMQSLVLKDFEKVSRSCSVGQQVPRYQIIEYIEEHFREPLSLDMIASEFGITPIYLSSWFKKNIGINLSAHITNVRMEEAKRLLTENRSMKVLDVAKAVGILSISTFIRQFKNYTGTTPDQYRKLN